MSASKLSRILCLLLSLSLCFVSFGSVNVHAASDETNLIESDLRDWQSLEGSGSSIIKYNDVFLLVSNSEPFGNGYSYVKSTLLYDLSQLVAGNSYTFSFEVLDLIEAQSLNAGMNWENYYGGPASRSGAYVFGLGSFDYSTNNVVVVDNIFIDITNANYSSMYGISHTLTFDMPNVVNPCIFIYYAEASENYQNQYIMLRNLSLIDNTKANTDSILERIFNWFEIKFNNLSSSFTDLGNRISGFFSNLSSNISDGLSNVREGITTKFGEFQGWLTSLGDRISGFFTTLGSSISTGLSDVRDKINDKIVEISEKFTDFFEKFKPRVYFNLKWVRGTINGTNGELINTGNDAVPLIIVSDFFTVPEGSKYLVDYTRGVNSANSAQGAYIFQYDLSGKYIGILYSSRADFTEFELPAGYMYRFRQSWLSNVEIDNSAANDSFSVYADEGWINAMLFNLKNMIKGLFVPDEAFIMSWTESMEDLASERLGIIWQAGDFLVTLITTIVDLVVNAPEEISLALPAIDIDVAGMNIHLWDEQKVDFSFLETNGFFAMFYSLYKVILNVSFGIPLLHYARKELDNTLHN